MSVVLCKRRLAPQKYIRMHESRRITIFSPFAPAVSYEPAMAMGIYTSTCIGTGMGVAWVWVQTTNGNFIVRSTVRIYTIIYL